MKFGADSNQATTEEDTLLPDPFCLETPLTLAIEENDFNVVEILLKFGAEPKSRYY